MADLAVSARHVSLDIGAAHILQDVSFDLPKGEVLALLGSSGGGKTSLLRQVAGLSAPTRGRIEIMGQPVSDAASNLFLPPEKRGLGMVFQDYALWPHMSVAANVSFPLEMRKVPAAERRRRVLAALDLVDLKEMADRPPSALSGGQQQRVAIARAIVAEPPLVLFDEPLSNLDRELREVMVGELGELVSSLGLTVMYVTHDQAEAFALADRIAVMRAGHIVQIGSPEELVTTPADADIAAFLRLGCLLPAHRTSLGWVIEGTEIRLADSRHNQAYDLAEVLMPARATRVCNAEESSLRAEVRRSQFRGNFYETVVRICGTAHDLKLACPTRLGPGDILGLTCAPTDLRWFEKAAA